MLEYSISQLAAHVGAYLLPFFRISSFFLAAPIFSTQMVPARVRMGLALLATLIVVPLLPAMPVADALSLTSLVIIVQQVLIGIAMAFVMQLFFHIFVLGGQMMAMQMALGMASMVDPANGISVTIVAQFYLMMITLVFVAINGHLVMLDVLIESFAFVPVASTGLNAGVYWELVSWGSWLFVSGLLLALPAVTALLIVNFAFGVMTRAAPQLNIFSLGFPVSMVFGLFIIWVSLSDFLPKFDLLTLEAFDKLKFLLGV
jgi:flagellar biosynthetic protein FliR